MPVAYGGNNLSRSSGGGRWRCSATGGECAAGGSVSPIPPNNSIHRPRRPIRGFSLSWGRYICVGFSCLRPTLTFSNTAIPSNWEFYRWRCRDRCRHRLEVPRRPAQSQRLRWRQRQPSRFGGIDNDIWHFEKSIFKSPAQKIELPSTGGNACGMTVIEILTVPPALILFADPCSDWWRQRPYRGAGRCGWHRRRQAWR